MRAVGKLHFCDPCYLAATSVDGDDPVPYHYCEPTCRADDCPERCQCGLDHGTSLERAMARSVLDRLAVLGHSQAWLAEALGVSQKHVSRVLHLRNGASFDWWQRCADVLAIDWLSALGGTDAR